MVVVWLSVLTVVAVAALVVSLVCLSRLPRRVPPDPAMVWRQRNRCGDVETTD